MIADDIEQLLQEIPVHPPAVVPVRTVQEAVAAGECLDVHLLKPARLDVPPGQPNVVCADDMQPAPAWFEYPFRKSHSILRWFPINWTAGELNAILENNLVPFTSNNDNNDNSFNYQQ
jgi:hypothetical protein